MTLWPIKTANTTSRLRWTNRHPRKSLEDFQNEISNETVNAINNEIASETKRHKEKEFEPAKKDGKAQIERAMSQTSLL